MVILEFGLELKLGIWGCKSMIIYDEIPKIVPEYIREKFKEFNYKVPIKVENPDPKGYSKERKEFCELLDKIKKATEYDIHDLNVLLTTICKEVVDKIDILEIIRTNNDCLSLELLNRQINEIKTKNKQYRNFEIKIDLKSDHMDCSFSDFYEFIKFELLIYGERDINEKEFIKKVEIVDNYINKLIEITKEQKIKEKNRKMELFKKYYSNEDNKKKVDSLIDYINSNNFLIKDFENCGEVGKWAKFKIENIDKKIQEIRITPEQMEETIKRAEEVVRNSASWKDVKPQKK